MQASYAMQIRLAMLLKRIDLLGRLKIEVALILKEGGLRNKAELWCFNVALIYTLQLCV